MRKRLALVLVTGMALVALASGPAGQADPATVIDDDGCAIIPADSGLPVVLITTESLDVKSSSGNVTLTCHFDIPEGMEPAETMHHSGFACSTHFGATTNSWSVTTKGGVVLLRCQIKA